ncbi:MAG: hypothetical protein JJ850_05135 [Kordiimonadaceae bacterium]|nr:hypothetical protein [Kordiimonadaceae bacterium]MBO6568294.1 hypothetical protein [Kordiimonadaceae bacterium]MBO6963976.1 hypothetical protein [Kordiimonadaceae bacterium]
MIGVVTATVLAIQTLFGPAPTTKKPAENQVETVLGVDLLRQCVPSMLKGLTKVFRKHLPDRVAACTSYLDAVKGLEEVPARPYVYYERARLNLLDKKYDLARADLEAFRAEYRPWLYSDGIEDMSPIGAEIMDLLIDFRVNNPADILAQAAALSQKYPDVEMVHQLYVSIARHLDDFEHSLAADQFIERLQPSSRTVQRIANTQKLIGQPQAAADTLQSWFLVGPSRPDLRSPVLLYAAIQNDLGNSAIAASVFSLGSNVSSPDEIDAWRQDVFVEHGEIADLHNWGRLKIRDRDTIAGSSVNVHVERTYAYLNAGKTDEALSSAAKLPSKCGNLRCLEAKAGIARLGQDEDLAKELEEKLKNSVYSTQYKSTSKRDRDLVRRLNAVPVERLLAGRPSSGFDMTAKKHFSGDWIIKLRAEGPVDAHIIRQALLAKGKSAAKSQNAWGFIAHKTSTRFNYRQITPDSDDIIEVAYTTGEMRIGLIESQENLAASLAPWRVTKAD